ncbi:MAG: hypothetical protein QOD29_3966 [Alphaproteobacteria bacterium]|nr:hypothetical protein [Alphaproteobacteria bacterium]
MIVVSSVCCAWIKAPSGADVRLVGPVIGDLKGSTSLVARSGCVIHRLLRAHSSRCKGLRTDEILFGLRQCRLGLGHLCIGSGEGCFIRAWVDLKEDVADFDRRSLVVLALEENATDLRVHLDDPKAHDPARILQRERDVPSRKLDDADLRRRRRPWADRRIT